MLAEVTKSVTVWFARWSIDLSFLGELRQNRFQTAKETDIYSTHTAHPQDRWMLTFSWWLSYRLAFISFSRKADCWVRALKKHGSRCYLLTLQFWFDLHESDYSLDERKVRALLQGYRTAEQHRAPPPLSPLVLSRVLSVSALPRPGFRSAAFSDERQLLYFHCPFCCKVIYRNIAIRAFIVFHGVISHFPFY